MCIVDEFVSGGSQLAGFENPNYTATGNVGSIGALGWSTNSLVLPNRQAFITGLVSMGGSGSPTSFNHMRLWPSINAGSSGAFEFDRVTRMKWILRVSPQDATAFVRVGFMDDVISTTPANGVYFETRDGVWWAVARALGSSIETSTGVPFDNAISAFYQLMQIQLNSNGNVAEFYIDGVLKASVAALARGNPAMNLAVQNGGNVGTATDFVSVCVQPFRRIRP